MRHVLLFLLVFVISTGSAGSVVTAILWYRTRDRIAGLTLLVVTAFALGLSVAILSFYLTEIVGYAGNLETVVTWANSVISLVMYAGLGMIVVRATSARPTSVALVATPSLILILLTALRLYIPGLYAWSTEQSATFVALSVGTGSLFLGYSGYHLARGADRNRSAAVVVLISWLGWALTGFAAVAIVATGTALALGHAESITLPFNFVLYLSWNVIAIRAFLKADRSSDVQQPGVRSQTNLLVDGAIPPAVLERYGITAREADVIRLVAQGLPNKQIASDLGVSFATVRTHLYNVFRKTGVGSRMELVRLLSGSVDASRDGTVIEDP